MIETRHAVAIAIAALFVGILVGARWLAPSTCGIDNRYSQPTRVCIVETVDEPPHLESEDS